MKIISNKKYQAFWDVIIKQQKMIDDRDKKIKELEKRASRAERDLQDLQNFCMNFAADQSKKSLDFPNSYEL